MKPGHSISDYLNDMLDAASEAESFVEAMSFDDFASSRQTILAVTKDLEIVGEAAKHIPDALRSRYADVPWRNVAGMRDSLAHGYFSVDLIRMWNTVRDDLPALRRALHAILADIGEPKGRDG